MIIKKINFIVFLFISFYPCLFISQENININNLIEENTDHMGFYKKSREYEILKGEIKIINLPEYRSFFAIWLPYEYEKQTIKRTLIALHGSDGTVYPEIRDELEFAKKYKYAIVAIQWWLGEKDKYLSPQEVYKIIEISVKYMNQKYGSSLNKCAYIGFSRGSVTGYEITFLDKAKGNNYLALTICHSGHMPPDMLTPFFQRLLKDEFGKEAYLGKNFFVYCGMKDEEWEERQCDYMKFSKSIVEEYGGKIVGDIIDPNGKHLGLRLNKQYHENAIKKFIELTSY